MNAGFGVGNERLVVERKRRCRDLVPDLPSRRHLATLVDSVAQKLRRRALNVLMVVRSSASALATSAQAAVADSAEVFLRRCAAKQQPLLSNVSSPVTRWTRGCLHPHASLPCPRSNDPSRILKPDARYPKGSGACPVVSPPSRRLGWGRVAESSLWLGLVVVVLVVVVRLVGCCLVGACVGLRRLCFCCCRRGTSKYPQAQA
jgi:hypothetical protein